MTSSFADILRHVVDGTPGAVGGSFAAWDGETVDYVSSWEDDEWRILTAHYGVVLAYVQAALHTFHFGEAETICLTHAELDIVIQAVKEGYYALVALEKGANLGRAIRLLEAAAVDLREEMG